MISKNINLFLYLILLVGITFFLTRSSYANGGDQRVVEGKYLINLSRSPFTPKAGENVAMIASFFDIQRDKVIAEDLVVKIRIARLGEGRERRFLYEQADVLVKGGILEFQHTFNETGLHEIFFDFAFASDPQKAYNAPDFLLDVQKTESGRGTQSVPIWIGLGTIFGFGVGWFVFRRRV